MERRDLVKMVLLTVLTCGIWGIVWTYQIGNDIAALRGSGGPNPVTDILLGFVTCGIWFVVISYQWPKLLNDQAASRGKRVDDNLPVLSLVACLFGFQIVGLALMQQILNDLPDGRG
ncbi:MAG: DUF4234 domain-containing protein [Deltaproteobacteria bacterium]|nr:DUF4234 domain-containing protein [Deltaproteobacteria bacterium]